MADPAVIIVTLAVGATTVVFDDVTADVNGNVWTWTKLEGWWEPPESSWDALALGRDIPGVVTADHWQPRDLKLAIVANCRAGDLTSARITLTAMCNMLSTPGTLTVDDGFAPRYAEVLLADRPTHGVLLGGTAMEADIPLVADDAYRYLVSDDTGVI